MPVTTFLLPVEGLTITCLWEIGSVQLYPGAQLRSLLGDNAQAMLGHEVIGDVTTKFVEELEQGTVARVEATDIDAALDLLTLATDLLRVFLKKGAQFRTTMFGLPGQMYRSQIRYVTAGAEAGPGIRNRGEAAGVTFDDSRHAAWLNSPTFATLASLVGTDHPPDEGPRRALLGVQLLSQAILEHRPAFKMLGLVIALESMLLERGSGTQTLRFLRRATYFTCGRAIDSLCGRDRPPCQFLTLNPAVKADRGQLDWLRQLAEMGPPWDCGERASYSRWYELRSAVAHGDDDPVTSEEASQAEYWIFMWTLEPVLQWLVEHPVKPLEALDEALAVLGPVPHWQKPVPNPATYNPDDYANV